MSEAAPSEARGNPAVNWVFTVNGEEEALKALWDDWKENSQQRFGWIKHLVVGQERGEGGRFHLQGFLQTTTKKRLEFLKKHFHGGAHYAIGRGTVRQAVDYITSNPDKPNPVYFSWGVPTTQGKPRALDQACERIRDGGTIESVAKEFPATYVVFNRGLQAYQRCIRSVQPLEEPDIRIWTGAPGTGKSYSAREWINDHKFTFFLLPDNEHGWVPGDYADQDVILIEDFAGLWPYDDCKLLFDRYESTHKTKGGFTKIAIKRFCITSNYDPDEWYGTRESTVPAIRRRLQDWGTVHKPSVPGQPRDCIGQPWRSGFPNIPGGDRRGQRAGGGGSDSGSILGGGGGLGGGGFGQQRERHGSQGNLAPDRQESPRQEASGELHRQPSDDPEACPYPCERYVRFGSCFCKSLLTE